MTTSNEQGERLIAGWGVQVIKCQTCKAKTCSCNVRPAQGDERVVLLGKAEK